MSGQLTQGKTQGMYLPTPTGGLNLISPPLEIDPHEALQLRDYTVFSWGIRERGGFNNYGTISNGSLGSVWAMPYVFESGSPLIASPKFLVISGNTTSSTVITNYDVNTNASTTLTYAGPNLGSENMQQAPCVFDGWIYIGTTFNSRGIAWQIGTSTVNTLNSQFSGFSGSLFAPFAYKRRLYFVGSTTNLVWFADPLAILGALSSFDFSTLISDGSVILFACSWGYNQGLDNDELFVVVTTSGQVIIYSGDWPAASNWSLVSRTQIPTPLGASGYLKQGQNIFIQTVRGIVSLKDFLAGSQSVSDNYYLISKNLGPITTLGGLYPVINAVDPFIFFPAPSTLSPGELAFYVLNYELGAWSTFETTIGSLGQFNGVTGIISDPNSNKMYLCNNVGTVILYNPGSSSVDGHPTWQSPYLKLVDQTASAPQKFVSMIRSICRSITGGNGNVVTSCSIASNFTDTFGAVSSQTTATGTTGANSTYVIQEMAPAGQGTYISVKFQKTNNSELNEIGAVEIFWNSGGGAY